MGADVNVRTFEDTMRLCEQNSLLKKKVEASIASTRIIRNSEKLDVPDKNRYEDEAKVLVSPFSTIEAAFDYTGANHIAVLKYDGDDPTLMPEEDWYEIDVISCIPPDTSSRAGNRDYYVNPKDLKTYSGVRFTVIHEKRLRRIMDAALANGCDTIILCAFGCGRAKNPPHEVADAASNVIRDYLHAFKYIEFAICDAHHPGVLQAFEDAFKTAGLPL